MRLAARTSAAIARENGHAFMQVALELRRGQDAARVLE
jgi:hypothetical protein